VLVAYGYIFFGELSFEVFCPILLFYSVIHPSIYLFFWLPHVFIAVHGFSLVAARRGPSVAVSRLLFLVASLISGNRI